MAVYQHPGLYVEEKPGAPAPIQGLSATTAGLLGWTEKGPAHEATLITSMQQFRDVFGEFLEDERVPLSLSIFFNNGGARAYIVRTTPASAVDASLFINDDNFAQDGIELGDGTAVDFTGTLANPPLPSSLVISYWGEFGTPIVAGPLGTGDAVSAIWTTGTPAPGEGQLTLPANLPIKPSSVTIHWTSTGAKAQADDGLGGFTGHGNPAGSSIDYGTGEIVLDTTGVIPDKAAITIDYTYYTQRTITDNGAGVLVGDVDPGTNTISYTTGAYSFKAEDKICGVPVFRSVDAVYDAKLWQLDMQWPGVAGNSFRVTIEGSPNYAVRGQATFTRWNLAVEELGADGVTWKRRELFEDLSFTDSNDAKYFPSVVNDQVTGSQFVTVVTPSWENDVPETLKGVAVVNEVLGSGTGTDAQFDGTLVEGTCNPYSFRIDAPRNGGGVALAVTDDGSGNLIGDVDPTGVNTINYDTGAYDVTFEANVAAGVGNILADYYTAPATDEYLQQMSGGTDGSAVASSDIISPTLEADYKGMYAFNRVEENLLIWCPDFAGDETVDAALIDFAASKKDRFVLCCPPSGLDAARVKDYKLNTLNKPSSFAAMYWPWPLVYNPISERNEPFPPMAHAAGVMSRVEQNKNIGKAPAGREDGQLFYFVGLEHVTTEADMDTVYPVGINCIYSRPQIGTAVWGARTMDPTGGYRYVNARLLAMFLWKAIYNGLWWVPFENNGPGLWNRMLLQVNSFLKQLFGSGYFAGTKESDAFFVVCNDSVNTPENVNSGLATLEYGFAPNVPAEFVVLRYQKITKTS